MNSALNELEQAPEARGTGERIERLKAHGLEVNHGFRARYNAGCRCLDCKRANREYEAVRIRKRIIHGPARVSVDRARAHVLALQNAGMGRRAIAAAAGCRAAQVFCLIHRLRRYIAAQTEARILAVTMQDAADRSYIPAAETWRLIDELVTWGYSKAQLARWLGYETPALQFRKSQITKANADCVAALYNRLAAGFVRSDNSAAVISRPAISWLRRPTAV